MAELTPGELATWRGTDAPVAGSSEEDQWIAVLDAVEEHFGQVYTVPDNWSTERPDIRLALLMQANRLLKRPDTPDGVAGFADFGVVRIGRFDPDIDELLAPQQNWNMA